MHSLQVVGSVTHLSHNAPVCPTSLYRLHIGSRPGTGLDAFEPFLCQRLSHGIKRLYSDDLKLLWSCSKHLGKLSRASPKVHDPAQRLVLESEVLQETTDRRISIGRAVGIIRQSIVEALGSSVMDNMSGCHFYYKFDAQLV